MKQKLIFGCSICPKTKEHRHCPQCNYEMDFRNESWNYGKHCGITYSCGRCGNIIKVTNGYSDIRYKVKTFNQYINDRFIEQQRQKNQ